jgi:hypothetical protein
MRLNTLALASLLLILPSMYGCSKPETFPASATAADGSPAEAAVAAPASRTARACELVTAAEMSVILGSPVLGTPNEGSTGKTECVYAPAGGISPQIEFSVTWGDGRAAMTAMGMMGNIEPGIANPYEGLGDQAAAVGPALMIRNGEDLVTLTFSGIDDAPTVARKIFDTAKGRM